MLDQLSNAEGTSDEKARKNGLRSGYDVAFGYRRTTKPLSQMTLDEVDQLQHGMGEHTPVGRYQITRKTLQGLRKNLGLNGNQVFNAELQDRMGRELMRGIGYDSRKLSPSELQARFANQWASVATANGKSVDPKQPVGLNQRAFFDTIARARMMDAHR